MAKIDVVMADGTTVKAQVIENMGYNHDVGAYAKFVKVDDREFVAVKRGAWREWSARDRLSGGRASKIVGM